MSQSESAEPTAPHLLLEPFRLTPQLTLPNRILMAPMTRCMASDDLVPVDASVDYYARRADAGLLITEATIISPMGQGYPLTPGLYSDAQVEGWRAVTDKVHAAGGRIFVQLWHVGRVSHPTFLNGELPLAPSAVKLDGRVPRTDFEYGTPRALNPDEISGVIDEWEHAAHCALAAGFDGIELHGANGYLIDQFLHWHTNRRTDLWGGDPERMIRFAIEVVDRVIGVVGNQKVAIRLSPGAHYNQTADPRDADVYRLLLSELEARKLAYAHVGIFDDSMEFDVLGGRVSDFMRRHYSGILVGNGSYSPELAAVAIADNRFDLVSVGRPFIANPDLIARVRTGSQLEIYDEAMLAKLDE